MASASSQGVETALCGADADGPSKLAQDFVASYYGFLTARPAALEHFYAGNVQASRTWGIANAAELCTVSLKGRAAIMQWITDTIGGSPEVGDDPLVRVTICSVQEAVLPDKFGTLIEVQGLMSLRREGFAVRRFEQIVFLCPASDGSGNILVHSDNMHSTLLPYAVEPAENERSGSGSREDADQRVDAEEEQNHIEDSTAVNEHVEDEDREEDGCEDANEENNHAGGEDNGLDRFGDAGEGHEKVEDVQDDREPLPVYFEGHRSWAAIAAGSHAAVPARNAERVDQTSRPRQDKGDGPKGAGELRQDRAEGFKGVVDPRQERADGFKGFVDPRQDSADGFKGAGERKGGGDHGQSDGHGGKNDAAELTGEQHTAVVDSYTGKGDRHNDHSDGFRGKGGGHGHKGNGYYGKYNNGRMGNYNGGGEGYHGRSDDYNGGRKGDGHKGEGSRGDGYKGRNNRGGGGYNGKGGRRNKGDQRGKPPSGD